MEDSVFVIKFCLSVLVFEATLIGCLVADIWRRTK